VRTTIRYTLREDGKDIETDPMPLDILVEDGRLYLEFQTPYKAFRYHAMRGFTIVPTGDPALDGVLEAAIPSLSSWLNPVSFAEAAGDLQGGPACPAGAPDSFEAR
jgi:hypothetical protein